MRTGLIGTVLAVALVSAFSADLRYPVQAAAQEKVWANIKGTIKSIDEKVLVITPSMDKRAQSSFELTPDVKRTGTLAVGEPVTVRYYVENGKRVLAEVIGKPEKK